MKRDCNEIMESLDDSDGDDEETEQCEDCSDGSKVSKQDLKMVKDMLDVAIDVLGHHSSISNQNKVHNYVHPNRSKNDNYGRKYLTWNATGAITSTEDEYDSNKIQIHFHDTLGKNKDNSFRDMEKFTLAALSFQGAFFANEKIGDETSSGRSNLYFFPFNGHDNYLSEKLTVKFEGNENAILVAAGTGWFAVVTSNSILRIYSTTGISLRTVLVQGRAVCLCGYNSKLGIIYQAENARPLYVDILDITCDAVNTNRIIDVAIHFFIPLSELSTLLWAGFSDLMMLTVADSNGIVSIMSKTSIGIAGWSWSPILDLTNQVSTRFWIVGIRKNALSYIPLSDGHSVPQRNHNQSYPTLLLMKLCLPLLYISSEEYLSRNYLRDFAWGTIILTHLESLRGDVYLLPRVAWKIEFLKELVNEQENDMNVILLKIAQQCLVQKEVKINRALDYLSLLRGKNGFEKGRMLGNFHNCSEVVEYVESILLQFFSGDEGDDHELTLSTQEEKNFVTPNVEKTVLPSTNSVCVIIDHDTKTKSNLIGKHGKGPSTFKNVVVPSSVKNPFSAIASPRIKWQHALKSIIADDLHITPKISVTSKLSNSRK